LIALYRFYERFIPSALRRGLRPLIHSEASFRQFVVYLAIGFTVLAIDLSVLRLLLLTDVNRDIAVSVAYFVAISAHFSLNRWCNFRNFSRSIHAQASTYLVVTTLNWLLTLGGVEAGVRFFALSPFAAKLFTIPLNLPVNFLGHRYLTFGNGILAELNRLRR
jgi:putative flippase GtrA